jgi:NAD dependent epimerase/dehydratase
MRALVTGAAGFIASHLVERLVSDGCKVRAFVRYNSRADVGHLRWLADELVDNVEIFYGDLRDQAAVARAMADVHVVYHLGALISIPYSYLNPVEVVETNIIGTLNVLMAAREHKDIRIVHTSTSEVYGTAQYAPIDEAHPLRGQSPYSASKIGADKLVESFIRSYGVAAVTVRPFNAYGPRQSGRAVIPSIIVQALRSDRIRLGNLSPTRDFTYVGDLVDGFARAGNAEGLVGDVINLGNGREISIQDLVQIIVELVGRELPVEAEESRVRPDDSEVFRLIADNTRAGETLGWQPAVSFREGLRRTIDWIGDHPEQYPDREQFV